MVLSTYWDGKTVIVTLNIRHLSSQSVGGLRLYLFPSLSGSPVISGDLARSMVTAVSRVCLL